VEIVNYTKEEGFFLLFCEKSGIDLSNTGSTLHSMVRTYRTFAIVSGHIEVSFQNCNVHERKQKAYMRIFIFEFRMDWMQ
jgi:hypothetical protein